MNSITSTKSLIALIKSANTNDSHSIKIVNNLMEVRFSDKLLEFLNSTPTETYSMLFLGILLEGGIGIPKDLQKAKILYEKAMEGGSGMAIYNLACMYDNGIGVAADYQKAKFLYEKAIENGHGMASYGLARIYQYGLGVPVDIQKAKFLYERDAKSGHAKSIHSLGYMHQCGEGVAIDYQKAKSLYKKAIDRGFYMSLVNLAHMYHYGKGEAVNFQKAKSLYEKAINHNIETAVDRLTTLYCDSAALRSDSAAVIEYYFKIGHETRLQKIYGYTEAIIVILRENRQLRQENKELKREIHKLTTHIEASPGGSLYFAARDSFYSNAEEQRK